MISTTIFLIQIITTILFCLGATILDIKQGVIPDSYNYIFVCFGLLSNFILSILTGNVKFIFSSIISTLVTYAITYMFWKLAIWGGGDTKLLTGISSVIPFGLNIDFLNISPIISVYPFSFTVIVNSILVSFPFLLIFMMYLIIKNDFFKQNSDFLLNIFNYNALKYMIDFNLNNIIPVNDLMEGMIVNESYFNDKEITDLINSHNSNLKVFKTQNDSEYDYYFKSQTAGGITKKDVCMLKIMGEKGMISDEISIKLSFPFVPSIFAGLLIAVFFGDMMMFFTKNLIWVI